MPFHSTIEAAHVIRSAAALSIAGITCTGAYIASKVYGPKTIRGAHTCLDPDRQSA